MYYPDPAKWYVSIRIQIHNTACMLFWPIIQNSGQLAQLGHKQKTLYYRPV